MTSRFKTLISNLLYLSLGIVLFCQSSTAASPFNTWGWSPSKLPQPDYLDPSHALFRLTYENLSLPEDEDMGILGGTFLFETTPWLSLGPAAYAAVSGHRGGFITLGAAANTQKNIFKHLLFDAGFFLGAGGGDGGYTLVGGGLMLRGHAGLYLTSDRWGHLGVGASIVDFPDGSIHSVQPYVGYEYPFELYTAPSWLHDALPTSLAPISQEFSLVYRYYMVPDGVIMNGGQPQLNFGLLGVEWFRYLHEKLFVTIEAEGALQGESNGYMQIFLGGGLRLPIFTHSTFVKLMGEIGGAGGGGVFTGGGLLLDGGVGLQQYITPSIYLAVNGDYLGAPSGEFRAAGIAAQIGYGFEVPETQGSAQLSQDGLYTPNRMRIRATNQTYFKAAENWRLHHEDESVNNLGLQIDYYFLPYWYLSGQGLAAYLGNAGAYMTGLVGPGLTLPLFHTPLFVNVEGLFGAAGGGGLNLGGGFVWQGNAGIGTQFNDAVSVLGYYGYINAPNGEFSANVFGVSLNYRFTLFSTARS